MYHILIMHSLIPLTEVLDEQKVDTDRSKSPTYSHDGSLTPTPEDLDIDEPDTPKSTGEGMLAYTIPLQTLTYIHVQVHVTC